MSWFKERNPSILLLHAICNDDGAIATDLKLLKHLSNFLYRERIPVMVTKKALVSMATYLPQDKESFIKLAGTGEKLYNKCGERFISEIRCYLEENS